jgi:hypothetical protein
MLPIKRRGEGLLSHSRIHFNFQAAGGLSDLTSGKHFFSTAAAFST